MIAKIRKAITAAVTAAITTWLAVRSGGLTADEIGGIAGAAFAAGAAVWAVPNR